MQRRALLIAFSIALSWLTPDGGGAADGAIEINQACATSAAGCFPGDAGGFPVTIAEPGSYRLTGNLTTSDPGQILIQVAASHVEIDLGGFELAGPADCTVFPCTNTGVGPGIFSFGSHLVVRNGTVRGMGNAGVLLNGPGNRVERVRAVGNGSGGIRVAGPSVVSSSLAAGNAQSGIRIYQGRVQRCLVTGNELRGIEVASGTEGAPSVSVSETVALANGGTGIAAQNGSIVENLSVGNAAAGLQFFTQQGRYSSGYARNVISGNGATVAGTGRETGPNVCDGNTTCP